MSLAGTTASSSNKKCPKKQQIQDYQLGIHQFAFLNGNSQKKCILLLILLIIFWK